jgi:putative (di)nucleoside polyphosphate hydrolase
MIDKDGFRFNVGIILANFYGQVLWAKRFGWNAWQFPQGGISRYETPEDALYRELKEEVGLLPEHVNIISCTNGWLKYRLPRHMVREESRPLCIGQKQKWFLLEMLAPDAAVKVFSGDKPEFDAWCWVSYWYPVNHVVFFKQKVYRRAMRELCRFHSRIFFGSHS